MGCLNLIWLCFLADVPEIAKELHIRHARGFKPVEQAQLQFDGPFGLKSGGHYQWRRRGERHSWNPTTITLLQNAVRSGDEKTFDQYSKDI